MKKKGIKVFITVLLFIVSVLCLCACKTEDYTVIYTAGEGGKIEGDLTQTIAEGKNCTEVTAVADDDCIFIEWSDGNKEPVRTDCNIRADTTITAVFGAELSYNHNEGGKIEGYVKQIVSYGGEGGQVTAVPQEGYGFRMWSDGVTAPERKDSGIKANFGVTAYFYKLIFNVEYKAAEGGYIAGEAVQAVKNGDYSEPVVACPADDSYRFDRWSDGSEVRGRRDFPQDDLELTAYFVKRGKATLTYQAGAGGSIEGQNHYDTYEGIFGDYVTAVPDAGYAFEAWSDGKTSATRRDEAEGNKVITALFKKIFEGQGSKEYPYLVNDYQGLRDMIHYPFAYYRMTKDIDLSGISYLPVFNYSIGFYGDFDGGGFTVKNMTINQDTLYPSLFVYTGAGKIHDLNMTGVSIRIPNAEMPKSLGVGAVVSVANGELKNVCVSGKITGESLNAVNNTMFIGGLVGLTFNKVTNCSSDMDIELIDIKTKVHNQLNVGGLIGMMGGDVTGCRSGGTIRFTADKSGDYAKNIGGLIGVFSDAGYLQEITVSGCVSETSISGSGYSAAGGLIAHIFPSDVTFKVMDSFSSGDIVVDDNSSSAGGLICYFKGSGEGSEIRNCHTSGNVRTGYSAAGFVNGFISQNNVMTINDCSSSGDVYGRSQGCGFAIDITGSVVNCYSESTVEANHAAGFVYTFDGSVKQCFYSGNVIAKNMGSGFV